MTTALQQVNELIENFSFFDDWEDRYRYLIDLGKTLPGMPDSEKTEKNLVRGCTSQVWMVSGWDGDPANKDGAYRFDADSDAHIVRGLIAILIRIYNGRTAAEIKQVNIRDLFEKLGLEQNLSPNRRNGFFSIVERIRKEAEHH